MRSHTSTGRSAAHVQHELVSGYYINGVKIRASQTQIVVRCSGKHLTRLHKRFETDHTHSMTAPQVTVPH